MSRIPTPCRDCDHREDDRCLLYGVKVSTASKGFDAGLCYGRTVSGERSIFVARPSRPANTEGSVRA